MDTIYPDPKDMEHSVYQTALVGKQACKSGHLAEKEFGSDIITYTASLPGKL